MARNAWRRWGRGSCVGYRLNIGDGYLRFDGNVARGVKRGDGTYAWSSSINGICPREHATVEEAKARVESELAITGSAFVESFLEFASRRWNRTAL